MDRNEVEEIIRDFAPDALPLFADHWGRWPVGPTANEVQNLLWDAEYRYRDFGCIIEANKCHQAAVEIGLRRNS